MPGPLSIIEYHLSFPSHLHGSALSQSSSILTSLLGESEFSAFILFINKSDSFPLPLDEAHVSPRLSSWHPSLCESSYSSDFNDNMCKVISKSTWPVSTSFAFCTYSRDSGDGGTEHRLLTGENLAKCDALNLVLTRLAHVSLWPQYFLTLLCLLSSGCLLVPLYSVPAHSPRHTSSSGFCLSHPVTATCSLQPL